MAARFLGTGYVCFLFGVRSASRYVLELIYTCIMLEIVKRKVPESISRRPKRSKIHFLY